MPNRYPGGLIRKVAANNNISSATGVWDLNDLANGVKTNTWPIAGVAYPVSGSLRFRASASAYLSRTPSATGSQTTWTWSGWVKQSSFGTNGKQWLLTSGESGSIATNYTFLSFSAQGFSANGDQLQFFSALSNSTVFAFESSARFRDPSAWYHVVAAIDTTQATASNRIKLYINGVQITAFATATYPAQNTSIPFINSSSYETKIGSIVTYGFFDGYMAEINFVDGQALTPSSFGQTSPITGVWEPIKYTGTYGTNGYYLSLSDTSSIGKDFSGNGNNWTPNNISTTSGATFDLMRDVPTQWAPQSVTDVGGVVRGNYCTLNSVGRVYGGSSNYGSFTNGNLSFTTTANPSHAFGTIAIPTNSNTGFYWEAVCTSMDNSRTYVGIVDPQAAIAVIADGASYGFPWKFLWERSGYFYNTLATDGSADLRGQLGGGYVVNDVIMIAIKNGSIWFGKNGSWGLGGDPSINTGYWDNTIDPTKTWLPYVGYNSNWNVNFGQRPFTYTPPSGFKSLCTTNLPTPTIGATTATAANKYFDATLYTGTGATLSVTNAGSFQPDFVWLKSRSAATNNQLFDAIRGTTKVLVSNSTEAESTSANTITSFNSGGFTVGTNTAINTSTATYVGWQWWAGGSTVTNNSGSISSQVRASTTAGFSIVTFSTTAVSTQTWGHGLGVAPKMVIVKSRGSVDNWYVYHASLGNASQIQLNSTAASVATNLWNSTTPSSTIVTFGSGFASAANYVAYCFAEIAGYSAFGSYTGNGSTDGPFIFCGFRPKYILIKRTDSTGNWTLDDAARSPYNVGTTTTPLLYPNLNIAEANGNIDILSNGFKIRYTDSDYNTNGATYIYAAFAEFPFKTALAR